MQKIIMIVFLVCSGTNLWGQNTQIIRNNVEIRSILTNWDPIRGEWLSSSLTSLASNTPAPVRTFPELLTTSQLFAFVPISKRDSVEQLLRENDSLRRTAGIDVMSLGLDFTQLIIRANRRGGTLVGFNFGEPHIVDFDNKHTLHTSTGEFILAKSQSSNFEVQARFEKINNVASFTTAVSINAGGDIVSIYANDKPDNKDYTALRVNGSPATMINGLYYLPMGGIISYNNKQYRINSPFGESVIVEIKPYQDKKFINVAIEVIDEDRTNYDGLSVGSRDNNSPSTDSDFRIEKNSTLFNYSTEKDFEYFTRTNGCSTYIGKISESKRNDAIKVCQEAGVGTAEMEGCIYDYAHFGLAPNPRPIFIDPIDEITLVELNEPMHKSNETIAQVSDADAPVVATRRKRNVQNPAIRRELSQAFLRILIEAAGNAPGRVSIGR